MVSNIKAEVEEIENVYQLSKSVISDTALTNGYLTGIHF